jgi:ABC-type spermidine/putrescine transport system permease subunit I
MIHEPLVMLYTDVSMLVGMTYVYCPFMILPLYANLVKMDFRLLEAAHDLGASAWKAVLAGHRAAQQVRHRRRLHAGFHSQRR